MYIFKLCLKILINCISIAPYSSNFRGTGHGCDLPRVAAWQCSSQESNSRPTDCKSSSVTTTLPSHMRSYHDTITNDYIHDNCSADTNNSSSSYHSVGTATTASLLSWCENIFCTVVTPYITRQVFFSSMCHKSTFTELHFNKHSKPDFAA